MPVLPMPWDSKHGTQLELGSSIHASCLALFPPIWIRKGLAAMLMTPLSPPGLQPAGWLGRESTGPAASGAERGGLLSKRGSCQSRDSPPAVTASASHAAWFSKLSSGLPSGPCSPAGRSHRTGDVAASISARRRAPAVTHAYGPLLGTAAPALGALGSLASLSLCTCLSSLLSNPVQRSRCSALASIPATACMATGPPIPTPAPQSLAGAGRLQEKALLSLAAEVPGLVRTGEASLA